MIDKMLLVTSFLLNSMGIFFAARSGRNRKILNLAALKFLMIPVRIQRWIEGLLVWQSP